MRLPRAPDRRRNRGRRPAPPTSGWSSHALAALLGVSVRTIRWYVREGFLARPPFRGTATRYERTHVLRIAALQRCRAEGIRTLDAARARIEAMGDVELAAWVGPTALPAVRAAIGWSPPAPPPPPDSPAAAASRTSATPEGRRVWRLVPGVEIHVVDGFTVDTRVLVDALLALAKR